MNDTYPVYMQHFDVLLMRKGVSEDAAKPEDFKRVPVVAKDQVQALLDDNVRKEAGDDFHVVLATLPNSPTGPEMMARRRVMDQSGGASTKNW